jgi:hypothetical protein
MAAPDFIAFDTGRLRVDLHGSAPGSHFRPASGIIPLLCLTLHRLTLQCFTLYCLTLLCLTLRDHPGGCVPVSGRYDFLPPLIRTPGYAARFGPPFCVLICSPRYFLTGPGCFRGAVPFRLARLTGIGNFGAVNTDAVPACDPVCRPFGIDQLHPADFRTGISFYITCTRAIKPVSVIVPVIFTVVYIGDIGDVGNLDRLVIAV